MKKVLTIIALLITVFAKSQTLDTVSVSLTLRAQDWAWAFGRMGDGNDSATKAKVRDIRTQIRTANPAAWSTNVTVTGVSGKIVWTIYRTYCSTPFGEVIAMGTTTAERTTIYNNIRAINNSALQYFIGVTDGNYSTIFTNARDLGKSILIDN